MKKNKEVKELQFEIEWPKIGLMEKVLKEVRERVKQICENILGRAT